MCESASSHLCLRWKMYIKFDKLGLHGERSQRWLYATLPPAAEGPYSPIETRTTSPKRGRAGVLTKFGTTQLEEPHSSSSAHQHPIPQKMGHLTTWVLTPALLPPQ